MKYFRNTNIDTIGDFQGQEEEAVGIIDTILENIEDMIDEKYGDVDSEIKNADDIERMVWESVCNYSEDLDETEYDYNETADRIYGFVEVRVIGE